jgi:hypothetical protein
MVSVYEYVRVYVPGIDVFTVPDDAMRSVPLPSSTSFQVAPLSV